MCAKPVTLAAILCLMTVMTSVSAQEDAVGEVEINDKLISITGNGHQRTVACEGRKLEVMGSDHVVNVTGVCGAVEIVGVNNTVSVAVQPKGRLEIAGTDHTVRWKSAGRIAQSVTGTGHTITQTK